MQSAVAHPEAGLLLRKLMTERGLEAPLMGRTLASVCITEICDVEELEINSSSVGRALVDRFARVDVLHRGRRHYVDA